MSNICNIDFSLNEDVKQEIEKKIKDNNLKIDQLEASVDDLFTRLKTWLDSLTMFITQRWRGAPDTIKKSPNLTMH